MPYPYQSVYRAQESLAAAQEQLHTARDRAGELETQHIALQKAFAEASHNLKEVQEHPTIESVSREQYLTSRRERAQQELADFETRGELWQAQATVNTHVRQVEDAQVALNNAQVPLNEHVGYQALAAIRAKGIELLRTIAEHGPNAERVKDDTRFDDMIACLRIESSYAFHNLVDEVGLRIEIPRRIALLEGEK